MKIQEAVAIRLSKLMREKNMTRYSLCKKVAMNNTTIYNIMNDRCKDVTLGTIYLICEGLDIDVIEFFNDDIFKKENLEVD